MPRGDKSAYTDKQKRKAEHIAVKPKAVCHRKRVVEAAAQRRPSDLPPSVRHRPRRLQRHANAMSSMRAIEPTI